MGTAYSQEKFLMEWQNAIGDAINYANSSKRNNNWSFNIQPLVSSYERDGLTIFNGVKLTTFVKGKAVSFWLGIDITSQTTGYGDIMMYFDEDTNDPDILNILSNIGKAASLSMSTMNSNVKPGVRLTLKPGFINSSDKTKTIYQFFTEVVNALRR